MATFLYHEGTTSLRRVDWADYRVWVPKSALPSASEPQFVAQSVAFNHARLGSHSVYVDAAKLDPAGLPPPRIYERIALLLQGYVARHGMSLVK